MQGAVCLENTKEPLPGLPAEQSNTPASVRASRVRSTLLLLETLLDRLMEIDDGAVVTKVSNVGNPTMYNLFGHPSTRRNVFLRNKIRSSTSQGKD